MKRCMGNRQESVYSPVRRREGLGRNCSVLQHEKKEAVGAVMSLQDDSLLFCCACFYSAFIRSAYKIKKLSQRVS